MPKVTGKTYEIGEHIDGLTLRPQSDGDYEVSLFAGSASICDVSRSELVQIAEALTDFVDTVAVDE